jgi:chemotaxis signal transduction protein
MDYYLTFKIEGKTCAVPIDKVESVLESTALSSVPERTAVEGAASNA